MTNFRKKLIKYYNYIKSNKTINLLFLISSILSTYLLITAFDMKSDLLGYAAVTGFNFVVMLIPMIISETKTFKKNIKNIIFLYFKFLFSITLINIVSFGLIYLSMGAIEAVFLSVNKVARFSNNIAFMFALYFGFEGLIILFTTCIILVYMFFKKMTIFNSFKYSRKFVRKRIVLHFLNCSGVVLLGAPVLYGGSKFNITSPLFSIFTVSYFILIFTYIIFDVKDEIDYVEKEVKLDIEKKKKKKSLWVSLKEIYIREKNDIVTGIQRKFNKESTNEKDIKSKNKENDKKNSETYTDKKSNKKEKNKKPNKKER